MSTSLSINFVKGRSGFISGVLSVGIYAVNDHDAILFDASGDAGTAKKISSLLESSGYVCKGIINTHHHSDHCGGNAHFQKVFPDMRIASTAAEKVFIESPELTARCFWSHAAPLKAFKSNYTPVHKAGCIVTDVVPFEDGIYEFCGAKFQIITQEGHSAEMIGIITPDNVFYCGDGFFGAATLQKYPLLYYTDIVKTLQSLQKVKTLQVDHYVMYHGGASDGSTLSQHVDGHVESLKKMSNFILSTITERGSITVEDLTAVLMTQFTIPDTFSSYLLTFIGARAYLSKLDADSKIQYSVEKGHLYFRLKQ